MNRSCLILLLILTLVACKEDKPQQRVGFDKKNNSRRIQLDSSSYMNRVFTEEDMVFIKRYLDHPDRNWDVKQTGSGIFYYIFESYDSTKAKSGDVAVLNYQISLLDGTVCYTSEEDGPAAFVIDKEDLESGLHEAVKMMGEGDKAVFIMHHSRAHGLLGDEQDIPPLQNVVFKLELVEIR